MAENVVPMNSLLAGTDFLDTTLTAFQSANRAETLKSLAQDINKLPVSPYTRTQFTPNSLNITMIDPTVSDEYCNKRGKAYLVDVYLACSCDPNYIGTFCQIQLSDYQILYDSYGMLILYRKYLLFIL